jgi:hypothetical protein
MSDLFFKNDTIEYNFNNNTTDIYTFHKPIINKLNYFINNKKIPHIVFHGPYGVGKRTILNHFIEKIYDNNQRFIKEYVMYVDCAHGKGIRFFRDQLKFFAKTNIQHKNNIMFKSIAENKKLLLNPILSRFCCIYIPMPEANNDYVNFYNMLFDNYNNAESYKKLTKVKNIIKGKQSCDTLVKCINMSKTLYNKGYSCLDLMDYIAKSSGNQLILLYFDKIRKQIRNEELLIFYVLYFVFMRKNMDLENIL